MLEKRIFEDKEFLREIDTYINDERVQLLKNIPHHNSNRLDHSLRVSYVSYSICKKLGLNYQSVAKAGLLHDLYFNRTTDCKEFKDKVKLYTYEHPMDAVKNAENLFYLTPLEKNIIVSHMWPLSFKMPKYKESVIVGLVDKYLSFKDFGLKFQYKLSFLIGAYFLFLTYLIYK